jgi:hypothetical protein
MPWFVAISLLVAGILVGIVAAAGPPARSQELPASLRVSMFGDSVMLGARDQLLAQFAGMPVTVDAAEDRSLLGAIGMFQGAPGALGDVVVLDLGYNDSDDPTVFRGRIDAAMAALSGVKRVIWLNQHEFTAGRAGMNAELAAAAARYPDLDVVDWNAEVAAHPTDVYGDAIHFTPSGQAAMAALVRQHFDRYVDSLRPTTTVPPTTTTTTTTVAPREHAQSAVVSSRSSDEPTTREALRAAVVFVAVVLVAIGGAIVARRRRSVRR